MRAGTDLRDPSVLVAPTRIEAMPMADVAPVMGQFGRLNQETGVFVPHDTVPEMPSTPTRERSWDLVGTPAKRPRTGPDLEMRSLTRSPPRERSPSFAPPPAPKRARAGPPAPPPPPPPAASGDGSRWVEITVFLTLIGILILIEENEAHAGGRRGRGAY